MRGVGSVGKIGEGEVSRRGKGWGDRTEWE